MMRTMAQAELGLSERHFPDPWVSSLSAGVHRRWSVHPDHPLFLHRRFQSRRHRAVSIAAHFAVGAAKTMLTMRSWWASGLEMTLVGILEAAVTYGLGLAFGGVG